MTALTPQQMRDLAFDVEHYDKYGDPYGEQVAPAPGNSESEANR